MSDKTHIEWTDATWNPLRGCSRVSEGCRHCYAEKVAARFSGAGQPYEGLVNQHGAWNGTIKLVHELIKQPLRWRRPRRIFVNSMSDLFHEAVPNKFIDQVFAAMALAPHHTFQVLTKRPERMLEYMRASDRAEAVGHAETMLYEKAPRTKGYFGPTHRHELWPLPNVWLGVSVEDQAAADERIPLLLNTPAAVRWISAEPLLGPIDLRWGGLRPDRPRLDWVVVGGESGSGARPMHPAWARSLRDQCVAAGVPYLFKQWGEWAPGNAYAAADLYPRDRTRIKSGFFTYNDDWICNDKVGRGANPFRQTMDRIGKKAAGRELDGRTWDEYPQGKSA